LRTQRRWLALTVAPLLYAPQEVARTSAATFTISYLGSMMVALVSGMLWDLTGIPRLSFVPLGLCAAVLLIVSFAMRNRDELR
jgi:hypothetical protein